MSKNEIYSLYDEIISLEASGDFSMACKKMRKINKCMKRRTERWQN